MKSQRIFYEIKKVENTSKNKDIGCLIYEESGIVCLEPVTKSYIIEINIFFKNGWITTVNSTQTCKKHELNENLIKQIN